MNNDNQEQTEANKKEFSDNAAKAVTHLVVVVPFCLVSGILLMCTGVGAIVGIPLLIYAFAEMRKVDNTKERGTID